MRRRLGDHAVELTTVAQDPAAPAAEAPQDVPGAYDRGHLEGDELATGARIATHHDLALGKVDIGDLAGAATLEELEPGPDPFAALLSGR